MWKFKLPAVLVLLVAFNGYGPSAPRLELVLLKDFPTDEEMIRDAPMILVGSVLSVDWVGAILPGKWRLVEVTTSVENIIRGDPGDTVIRFYFYCSWGPAWGESNSLSPGSRYVFFLMRDHGALRAFQDQRRTNIRVGSGKHNSLRFFGDTTLAVRIAEMLLTPGDDLNPSQFSSCLLHAEPFAQRNPGRWKTAKLLKRLLSNPHRAVRVGACEELTLSFTGQDRCWDTLDAGDGIDLRYNHGVISPRISRTRCRYHLLESAEPEKWLRQARQQYSKTELLDELKLLTADNDGRIRRKFCGLLKEQYPFELDSGCDGGRK